MTPDATKGAAFKKYGGPKSVSVVHRQAFYAGNNTFHKLIAFQIWLYSRLVVLWEGC